MEMMEKLVSLCKRRGFIFPGSEIYGGLANSWDYGHLGLALKENIRASWWRYFVSGREDMYGLESSLLMNKKVWEASGHLEKFNDPLSECKKCKNRFRSDTLEDRNQCPVCHHTLSKPREFNMMMKTFLGPIEEESAVAYFRPETAQGMFVDIKNVINAFQPELPFGLAQVGKAFRNEITPGNFIFRTREFEQMEIEYFIPPPQSDKDWQVYFDNWLLNMKEWTLSLGVVEDHIYLHEIPKNERAHYSQRTVDVEYHYPFGLKELYGIAYRGDYDLSQHQKLSGEDLRYIGADGQKFLPHVIEPSFGLSRTVLVTLLEAYREDEERVFLSFPPHLAPYGIAVFPLLRNKPQLIDEARKVFLSLKPNFSTTWDDIGNIGKRYRRQDEIGTPYCVTVDFETIEHGDVTVRDRDTMKQERIKITELHPWFSERLAMKP